MTNREDLCEEIMCLHCGKRCPSNEDFKHLPGCDGDVWDLVPAMPLREQNKKSGVK